MEALLSVEALTSQTISFSTSDPALDRAISLLNRLFPPPRTFTVRLWDGSELPAAARPAFSLILNQVLKTASYGSRRHVPDRTLTCADLVTGA